MPEIIATHLDNAMGLSDRKLAAPNSSHNSTIQTQQRFK